MKRMNMAMWAMCLHVNIMNEDKSTQDFVKTIKEKNEVIEAATEIIDFQKKSSQ